MPIVEVCLSPALLHLYDTRDKIVVVIDVFRATTTVAAALYNGADKIIPVASVEECVQLALQIPQSISAGERDGKVAQGLQHGNSPLEYPTSFIKGKTIVLTTTNGTKLIHMIKDAKAIVTGAFVNLDAVVDYLSTSNADIILACAAWKDRVNLEDTLFAGAVINGLLEHYKVSCDSALMALSLFQKSDGQLLEFLKPGNHYQRLSAYGLFQDLVFCTTPNSCPIVPVYEEGILRIR